MGWCNVCDENDLVTNSGICVLLQGQQVAIFQLQQANGTELCAVGNYDPIGGANVLSRGIAGSCGDAVVVASPLYKQHFNLRTGECLEYPGICVPVYAVKLQQGRVWLHSLPQQLLLQATAQVTTKAEATAA